MKRILIVASCLLSSNVFALSYSYDNRDYILSKEYDRRATEEGPFNTHSRKMSAYCYNLAYKINGLLEDDFYPDTDVEQNVIESVYSFKCYADQGDVYAQRRFGECLRDGIGVEQDLGEAVRYFELAENQGDARAQCNLGECLIYGDGVERNLKSAVHYFDLAANQGDAYGKYCYGECLAHGEGIAQNLTEAANCFKFAANQGNEEGQYKIGCCFRYGIGVEQNLEMARHYLRLAADQGDARKQNDLGIFLREEGGEHDLAEAAYYFMLATFKDYADGLYNYGLCLAGGYGVDQNLVQAELYFNFAAEQGHELAPRALEELHYIMDFS
jgi:TPR repeat protein